MQSDQMDLSGSGPNHTPTNSTPLPSSSPTAGAAAGTSYQRRSTRASAAAASSNDDQTSRSNASVTAQANASIGTAAAAASRSEEQNESHPSWSEELYQSHSFGSSDPSFPYELQEDRPTFQRYLADHFRGLTHIDLLKLGLWTPLMAHMQQLRRQSKLKLLHQQQQHASASQSTSTSPSPIQNMPTALVKPQQAQNLDKPTPSTTATTTHATSETSLDRRTSISSACLSPLPFDNAGLSTSAAAAAAASTSNASFASLFVSPSPLIFDPKTDPSFIIPPLGIPNETTTDFSAFGSLHLPSIMDEPPLLLQVGALPPKSDINELQQLVERHQSTLISNSSPSTSTAPAAKSTSVLVMFSNNLTGRRPSRPATPGTPRTHSNVNSTPSTPSAANSNSFGHSFTSSTGAIVSGANTSSLDGIAESNSDEPQNVLCEYILTTMATSTSSHSSTAKSTTSTSSSSTTSTAAVPSLSSSSSASSSVYSFSLSTLHPTHPFPSSSVFPPVWSEIESLALKCEEQIEANRKQKIRDAEAKKLAEEAAEFQRQLDAEKPHHHHHHHHHHHKKGGHSSSPMPQQSTSKTPVVEQVSVKLEPMDIDEPTSATVAAAAAASTSNSSVKLESNDSLASDNEIIDISTDDLHRLSPSPTPASRRSTPVPTDPDQLLKELLSLQLQLSHQMQANQAQRKAIIQRIKPNELQTYRQKQEDTEKYVLASYQRVARWQSIRLSMKKGTGDVVLPPALLSYHRNKYQYDLDQELTEQQPITETPDRSLSPTDAWLDSMMLPHAPVPLPKSNVELEHDLTMESYEYNDYSVCSVCFGTGPSLSSLAEEDQSVTNSNPLLFCEVCNVCVHLFCMGIASVPEEGEWVCQWCIEHPPKPTPPPPPPVSTKSEKRTVKTPTPPPILSPTTTSTTPTTTTLQQLMSPTPPMPSPINMLTNTNLNPFLSPTSLLSPFAFPLNPAAALMLPPSVMSPLGMPMNLDPMALLSAMSSSGMASPIAPMLDNNSTRGKPEKRKKGDDKESSDGNKSSSDTPSPMLLDSSSASGSLSPTLSSMKYQAKKSQQLDKQKKKARERESAMEAERTRAETERRRELQKRIDRKRREEEEPLPCCLCTVRGGALKPTDEFDIDVEGYMAYQAKLAEATGQPPKTASDPPKRLWAHIVCALWLPRTTVDDVATMQPIKGVKNAWKFRFFKHGLPVPTTALATSTTNNTAAVSTGKSTGLSGIVPPSLSSSFAHNAFAMNSLSNLPMLQNMNPLNLLSPITNPITGGPFNQFNPLGMNSFQNNTNMNDNFNPVLAGLPNINLFGTGGMNNSFNPINNFNNNNNTFFPPVFNLSNNNSNNLLKPFDFSSIFPTPTPTMAIATEPDSMQMGSSQYHSNSNFSYRPTPAPSSPTPHQLLRSLQHGSSNNNFMNSILPGLPFGGGMPSMTPTPHYPSSAPFLLPVPPLPLSLPAFHPMNSMNGLSGMNAAQTINTMQLMNNSMVNQMNFQLLSGSGSPKLGATGSFAVSSPPPLTASISTGANTIQPNPLLSPSNAPTMARATSLPTPLTLPPSTNSINATNTNNNPLSPKLDATSTTNQTNSPSLKPASEAAAAAATTNTSVPVVQQSGVCGLCKKAYGCCVYCSADLCSQSYHPLCAWYAGLYMRIDTGNLSTDIRYFLYCYMHTPLRVLGIQLIEDEVDRDKKSSQPSEPTATTAMESKVPSSAIIELDSEHVDKKRKTEEVATDSTNTTPPLIEPPTEHVDACYFPLVTLKLNPSSQASVSAFVTLFTTRNKLRLLQQREWRNRGRQETTKRAKLARRKRRLRLYGAELPSRRVVRFHADGTPILDRSTRGESKIHPREDSYELGRCAVCFHTDEEIRSARNYQQEKDWYEWRMQAREALRLGYAPPPMPLPPPIVNSSVTSKKKKDNTIVPPHVTAFHQTNPLLRCSECEIEVHAMCYGVQYDEVAAQLQAAERRKNKLQGVVKMGTVAGVSHSSTRTNHPTSTATSTGPASSTAPSTFTPFSAAALQAELDELHGQFEDEMFDANEEEENGQANLWKCRRCLEKNEKDITCALCFRKGGALKKTDCDSWVHVVCAQWIPEVVFANEYTLEPVTGLDEISPARRRLKCYLCKRSGPCIECSEHTCGNAFHPLCGMLSGQLMMEIHDSANSCTFLASCRKHTQLHLARFLPLPQDYTDLVWMKKKLDNSRVMLETLKQRAEEEINQLQLQQTQERAMWQGKRKPPPPITHTPTSTPSSSTSHTPAGSPNSSSRRGVRKDTAPTPTTFGGWPTMDANFMMNMAALNQLGNTFDLIKLAGAATGSGTPSEKATAAAAINANINSAMMSFMYPGMMSGMLASPPGTPPHSNSLFNSLLSANINSAASSPLTLPTTPAQPIRPQSTPATTTTSSSSRSAAVTTPAASPSKILTSVPEDDIPLASILQTDASLSNGPSTTTRSTANKDSTKKDSANDTTAKDSATSTTTTTPALAASPSVPASIRKRRSEDAKLAEAAEEAKINMTASKRQTVAKGKRGRSAAAAEEKER